MRYSRSWGTGYGRKSRSPTVGFRSSTRPTWWRISDHHKHITAEVRGLLGSSHVLTHTLTLSIAMCSHTHTQSQSGRTTEEGCLSLVNRKSIGLDASSVITQNKVTTTKTHTHTQSQSGQTTEEGCLSLGLDASNVITQSRSPDWIKTKAGQHESSNKYS